MASDARYSKVEGVLDLAIQLQGTSSGITLSEIADRYECGIRTSSRMLDAVRRAFGDHLFDCTKDERGHKRWRLTRPIINGLFHLETEEFAALDTAAGLAQREGDSNLAATLADVTTKLRALSSPDWMRRLDPDLEALSQAQGFACRPGPRPRIDEGLLKQLRHAVLCGRKVRILYRKTPDAPARWQTVAPLGVLYGNRHYLVALGSRRVRPVLYRLSRIVQLEETDEVFEPPCEFDLESFARQSFGVFQQDPIETVWRFKPSVASEAAEHCFHPDQEVEHMPDGSLIVRFRAGGTQEMAWHLFSWGSGVEILKPASLRRELVAMLNKALSAHARSSVRKAPDRSSTLRRQRR